MKWTNTDVVDNVYPSFTEADPKDNFYAYVLSDAYRQISEEESAEKAVKTYNSETASYKGTLRIYNNLTNMFNHPGGLTGDDAGIFKSYVRYLVDKDLSDEFALVREYIAEIEEIDTREELETFVTTGGKGYFRDSLTTKTVLNSPETGNTAVYIMPGTLPWFSGTDDASEKDADEKLEAYRQVLDLYFENDPEKAATYYADLETASDRLESGHDSNTAQYTYAELSASCTTYPLGSDASAYRDTGCDSFFVSDTGYIRTLDDICDDGGYRYSRAIAVYSVLMDSAYRLGKEYREAVSGQTAANITILYDSNNSTYGMFTGKYYTQKHGEDIRTLLTDSAEQVIAGAKDYFDSAAWLSDDTKDRVRTKLDNIIVRACGPSGDQWDQYDYSSALTATSLVGLSAEMRKINEEIHVLQSLQDRGDYWPSIILPQVYNAMYMPSDNSINLLTGYFQPKLNVTISTEELY